MSRASGLQKDAEWLCDDNLREQESLFEKLTHQGYISCSRFKRPLSSSSTSSSTQIYRVGEYQTRAVLGGQGTKSSMTRVCCRSAPPHMPEAPAPGAAAPEVSRTPCAVPAAEETSFSGHLIGSTPTKWDSDYFLAFVGKWDTSE